MSTIIASQLRTALVKADSFSIALACGALALGYLGSLIIYRLYFHPLASYPGPILAKLSDLYALSIAFNRSRTFKQYELIKKYGSPLRISPNELLFADLEAWSDIYGQSSNPCTKEPAFYNSFTVTGATNLLNATNKKQHARMRRLVSHNFSLKGILASESLLASKVESFVQHTFGKAPQDASVEIYQNTHQHYFDIIGQLSFGKPFDSLTTNTGTSYHDVNYFLDVVPISSLFPFLKNMPLKFIREGYQGVAKLENFSRQSLTEFISDVEKQDPDNAQGRFLRNLTTAKDAETGSTFTLDELVENVIIFLVAGSGTTAVATTYFIWELGRRLEIHRKVADEVRRAFPDPQTLPTYEEASKLPSLNATIEETLRLWSPLNVEMPRVSPGRVLGSHYIPKGATVSISSYSTARHPHAFPDPEAFIPERWLQATPEMRGMSRPFSTGSRNCVGKHLAVVNLALTLCRIFQLYDLTVDPITTEEMMKQSDRGTMDPKGGKLYVRARKVHS
ncbi:uncharacterized protein A1O9_00007 [Exophiala aquamarina CBS 119918]|uniref:Cytochrome P450 oxidoreductase n=1 Tax=Exophiala aquamarina CBS 119918 TaxID=1182545 RepID=A0A072Q2B2_9EURO|nr:uncharacterized protein A1O9_00007 [Exophiala aquamarina CBS 119918]KEF62035.1 hypothetical protein A1O9_00007 [Exophiala aquamarina CBS 119918]